MTQLYQYRKNKRCWPTEFLIYTSNYVSIYLSASEHGLRSQQMNHARNRSINRLSKSFSDSSQPAMRAAAAWSPDGMSRTIRPALHRLGKASKNIQPMKQDCLYIVQSIVNSQTLSDCVYFILLASIALFTCEAFGTWSYWLIKAILTQYLTTLTQNQQNEYTPGPSYHIQVSVKFKEI